MLYPCLYVTTYIIIKLKDVGIKDILFLFDRFSKRRTTQIDYNMFLYSICLYGYVYIAYQIATVLFLYIK